MGAKWEALDKVPLTIALVEDVVFPAFVGVRLKPVRAVAVTGLVYNMAIHKRFRRGQHT